MIIFIEDNNLKNNRKAYGGEGLIFQIVSLLLCIMFFVSGVLHMTLTQSVKERESKTLATAIADEGTVLLRNNGMLPLKPEDNVVGMGTQTYDLNNQPDYDVCGSFPNSMILGGLGSGRVNTNEVVSYYEGLAFAAKMGKLQSYTAITSAEQASVANKAIYFISRLSSETADNHISSYYLTDKEKGEILALAEVLGSENIVVVLNAGGVMDTTWLIEQNVGSIICAYYGGEMAGSSLASILTGEVNPSGKTVDTWADSYDSYPCVAVGETQNNNVSSYTEDIYTGYRYFETFDPEYKTVNYEFGFGLSYTEFDISLEGVTEGEDGRVFVTVNVTNIGDVSGKEVVQVYIKAPSDIIDNPSKELVGFAKTSLLDVGESETLCIAFDVDDMADFDDLGRIAKDTWVLQAGGYEIFIGNSIRNAGERGAVYTLSIIENKSVSEKLTSIESLLLERLRGDGSYEILSEYGVTYTKVNGYGSTVIQAENFSSGDQNAILKSLYQGAIGNLCVVGKETSATVSYRMYVEKAGRYNIGFALSSSEDQADVVDIYVNGELCDITVNTERSYDFSSAMWHKCKYYSADGYYVDLPVGDVTLTFTLNTEKIHAFDFFTLYSNSVSPDAETILEAENAFSLSKFGHFPGGMATGRSTRSGTTYSFRINAEERGIYYISLNASNVTAASANVASVSVNGVAASEKISLKRTAYGGWGGLSYGSSYTFINNMADPLEYYMNDSNSDDYMFTATKDVQIELKEGENEIVITTLDTAITCIDSITIRPEKIGAKNTTPYDDNTAEFDIASNLSGKVLEMLITYEDVFVDKSLLSEFLSQLSVDDLIKLSYLEDSLDPNYQSNTGVLGGATKAYSIDEKYKIPVSNTADGPAGVRLRTVSATWFPCMTMLASTYNVELAEEFGEVVGTECLNGGVGMWLAPGVNIHRDPLGGRNFEYLSEDPLVSADIASAIVKGAQSKGVSVCVKHYFANNQETERYTVDAHLSARAIREIYIKAFERVIENSSPWAIMTSYNRVNGEYVACSAKYVDILREDWGYDGLIVGDWATAYDHLSSFKAGNNIKSWYFTTDIMVAAYRSGIITRAELESNAETVIRYLMKSNTSTQPIYEIKEDVTRLSPTMVSDYGTVTKIYVREAGRYLLTEGEPSDMSYTVDGNSYTVGTDVYFEIGYHEIGYSGAEKSTDLVLLKVDEVPPYEEIVYFGQINAEDGQNKDIKVSIGEHSVYTDKNGEYKITVPVTDEEHSSIVIQKEGYAPYERSLDDVVINVLGEADLGEDTYELISEAEAVTVQPKKYGWIWIMSALCIVGAGACAGGMILYLRKKKK